MKIINIEHRRVKGKKKQKTVKEKNGFVEQLPEVASEIAYKYGERNENK